jgi:hypothetical protein
VIGGRRRTGWTTSASSIVASTNWRKPFSRGGAEELQLLFHREEREGFTAKGARNDPDAKSARTPSLSEHVAALGDLAERGIP